MIFVVIGIVVVLVALVVLLRSSRRSPDGVATFQRQIDALSPQARRRVIDRVQQLEHPADPDHPTESAADGS
jgi:hypothetical protein